MNKSQKVIVATGLVFVALCALFPPYYAEYRQKPTDLKKFLGYRFLFSPPSDTEIYQFLKGDLPAADTGMTEKEVVEYGKANSYDEAKIQRGIQSFRRMQESENRKLADPLLQRTSHSLDTARVWLQIGVIVLLAAGGAVLVSNQGIQLRMSGDRSPDADESAQAGLANSGAESVITEISEPHEGEPSRSRLGYWKHLFLGFRGRVPRRTYLFASLTWTIACVITLNGAICDVRILNYVAWTMTPLVACAFLALATKRLHDINLSGLWNLGLLTLCIGPVQLLGPILHFVVCHLQQGTVGPNKYGDDPLQCQ